MSTRYKLPEWLGGHEVDVHGTRGDGQLIVTPRGIGPTGVNPTEIHIDRDELTEVKPPLPPEPGPLAVVRDRHGMAWQREAGTGSPDWLSLSDHKTWQELNADLGPLTLLVPDPADDAPELPFTLHGGPNGEWLATVQPSAAAKGQVFMEVESTDYDPATARNIAAAILRAAREAETP